MHFGIWYIHHNESQGEWKIVSVFSKIKTMAHFSFSWSPAERPCGWARVSQVASENHTPARPGSLQQPRSLAPKPDPWGSPVRTVRPRTCKLNKWSPLNLGMIRYTAKAISVERILPGILAIKSVFLLFQPCFSGPSGDARRFSHSFYNRFLFCLNQLEIWFLWLVTKNSDCYLWNEVGF